MSTVYWLIDLDIISMMFSWISTNYKGHNSNDFIEYLEYIEDNNIIRDNNSGDIRDYIAGVYSTPWQYVLNPNLEVIVFNHIVDGLKEMALLELFNTVIFQNLIYIQEFFVILSLKISSDLICNNELFMYLYMNFFINKDIVLCCNNITIELDTYYNIFLELLYECPGYKSGLNHDLIIGKLIEKDDEILSIGHATFSREYTGLLHNNLVENIKGKIRSNASYFRRSHPEDRTDISSVLLSIEPTKYLSMSKGASLLDPEEGRSSTGALGGDRTIFDNAPKLRLYGLSGTLYSFSSIDDGAGYIYDGYRDTAYFRYEGYEGSINMSYYRRFVGELHKEDTFLDFFKRFLKKDINKLTEKYFSQVYYDGTLLDGKYLDPENLKVKLWWDDFRLFDMDRIKGEYVRQYKRFGRNIDFFMQGQKIQYYMRDGKLWRMHGIYKIPGDSEMWLFSSERRLYPDWDGWYPGKDRRRKRDEVGGRQQPKKSRIHEYDPYIYGDLNKPNDLAAIGTIFDKRAVNTPVFNFDDVAYLKFKDKYYVVIEDTGPPELVAGGPYIPDSYLKVEVITFENIRDGLFAAKQRHLWKDVQGYELNNTYFREENVSKRMALARLLNDVYRCYWRGDHIYSKSYEVEIDIPGLDKNVRFLQKKEKSIVFSTKNVKGIYLKPVKSSYIYFEYKGENVGSRNNYLSLGYKKIIEEGRKNIKDYQSLGYEMKIEKSKKDLKDLGGNLSNYLSLGYEMKIEKSKKDLIKYLGGNYQSNYQSLGYEMKIEKSKKDLKDLLSNYLSLGYEMKIEKSKKDLKDLGRDLKDLFVRSSNNHVVIGDYVLIGDYLDSYYPRKIWKLLSPENKFNKNLKNIINKDFIIDITKKSRLLKEYKDFENPSNLKESDFAVKQRYRIHPFIQKMQNKYYLRDLVHKRKRRMYHSFLGPALTIDQVKVLKGFTQEDMEKTYKGIFEVSRDEKVIKRTGKIGMNNFLKYKKRVDSYQYSLGPYSIPEVYSTTNQLDIPEALKYSLGARDNIKTNRLDVIKGVNPLWSQGLWWQGYSRGDLKHDYKELFRFLNVNESSLKRGKPLRNSVLIKNGVKDIDYMFDRYTDTLKYFLNVNILRNSIYNNQKNFSIKTNSGEVLANLIHKMYGVEVGENSKSVVGLETSSLFAYDEDVIYSTNQNNGYYWEHELYKNKKILENKKYFFKEQVLAIYGNNIGTLKDVDDIIGLMTREYRYGSSIVDRDFVYADPIEKFHASAKFILGDRYNRVSLDTLGSVVNNTIRLQEEENRIYRRNSEIFTVKYGLKSIVKFGEYFLPYYMLSTRDPTRRATCYAGGLEGHELQMNGAFTVVRYIAYLQDWEAKVHEHEYEKADIRGEFDKIYYKHKLVQWKEAWDDANNNYEKRRQLNIEKLDRLGFNMDLKKKIDGAFSEIRKAFAYFSKLNWGLTDKNIDNYFKTFIDPTLPLDIQKNSVKLLSSNVIVNVILKNHFININLGNNPMIDSRVFNRVANKFIIENMKTIFKVKFNKVFEERYGKSLWYDMIEEITSGDIISGIGTEGDFSRLGIMVPKCLRKAIYNMAFRGDSESKRAELMINFVKKHEEVFEYLDLDVGFPPKYSDDSSRPIDIYTTNLPYNNDLNYSLKYPVSMDVKVVERFYNTIVNTLGRYTIIKLYGPMAKDAISALRQEVYAGWYDYAKLMVPDKLDKKSIKDRLPANVGDYLEYLYNYDESRRDGKFVPRVGGRSEKMSTTGIENELFRKYGLGSKSEYMQLGNPSLAGKKSEYFEFLEDVFNYDAIDFQKYVMFIDNKPYDAVLAEKFITYYYPMMRIGVEIVLDFIYAYYNMLEFEAQQLELYKEARSSRLEVRKYSVKQEYVGVFGQIFELEKAVYYNYFFNYARKRNLIEFFFKIVGVITELFDLKFLPIFKDSIYITRDIDYTYMQNPQVVYTVNRLKRELLIIYFYFKILAYVVILLFFILCYVILSIFVLAVIKSNFPINSIYGVKKKDKHMSNLQDPMYIWRTFFFKNLSDLLGEDITFGIESKFIYSLSDNNKNFWLKYKIENKYVKDINIRVRRQYDILYRKFLSDEGFKNLENPERIAYTFEEILFFGSTIRSISKLSVVLRAIIQDFNFYFFNYGRNPIKKHAMSEKVASSEFFIYTELIPDHGREFYWKLKYSMAITYIKVKTGLKYTIIYRIDEYMMAFAKKVEKDGREKEKQEVGDFMFYHMRKGYNNHSSRRFIKKLDYDIKDTGTIDEDEEIEKHLFYSSKYNQQDIHLEIFNFCKSNESKLTSMEKEELDKVYNYYKVKFNTYNEYEGIQQDYIDGSLMYKKYFRNVYEPLDVQYYNKDKFLFKGKCIDYLIFKSLLKIVENNNNNSIKDILKQKINDLYNNNSLEQCDNIEGFERDLGTQKLFFSVRRGITVKHINAGSGRRDFIDNSYTIESEMEKTYGDIEGEFMDVKSFRNYTGMIIENQEKILFNQYLNNLVKSKQRTIVPRVKRGLYKLSTTIGSRIYYVISQFVYLFYVGLSSIKKIQGNEKSLSSLFRVFIFDITKYLNKIYGQYVLLFNKKKIQEYCTTKINMTFKDIFGYMVGIVTPLLFYMGFLIVSYLIVYVFLFYLNLLRELSKRCTLEILMLGKIFSKFIECSFILMLIYRSFKIVFISIKFLFTDIRTGRNILDHLYSSIYFILGRLQVLYYWINGAFMLGKNQKDIITGCIYVCKGLYLKLKVFFEKKILGLKICHKVKKNNNTVINIRKKICIVKLKIYLLYSLLRQDVDFLILCNTIEDICRSIFGYICNEYGIYNKEYYLYILFMHNIVEPYKEFLNGSFTKKCQYIVKKFIALLDNTNKKPSLLKRLTLKYQLHKFMEDGGILVWLDKIDPKYNNSGPGEEYFYDRKEILENDAGYISCKRSLEYKIILERHTNSGEHLQSMTGQMDWIEMYDKYIKIKLRIGQYVSFYMYRIHSTYGDQFNYNKKFRRNGAIVRIFKIINIVFFDKTDGDILENGESKYKDDYRNFFFFRRGEERNKIIFIYFVKGLINGITYYCFSKVIFKRVKRLKSIKFKKHKKFNLGKRRRMRTIGEDIHITCNLKKIPPQLGMLAILYELYYHCVVFYIYYEGINHYGKENEQKGPDGSRGKFKISYRFGRALDMGKVFVREIEYEIFERYGHTAKLKMKKCMDPILRVLLHLYERSGREVYSKNKSWFDISLKYALTYDVKTDSLPYEGREEYVKDVVRGKAIIPFQKKEILDLFVIDPLENELPHVAELIKKLKSQKLEKTLLKVKLGSYYMRADNASNSLPKVVDDIYEEFVGHFMDDNNLTRETADSFFYVRGSYEQIKYRGKYNNHILGFEPAVMENMTYKDIKKVVPSVFDKDRTVFEPDLSVYKTTRSGFVEDSDVETTVFDEKYPFGKYRPVFDKDKSFFETDVNYPEIFKVIYYEITLGVVIDFIKNSLNVKNKYVKAINIHVEPSLYLNINYENVENFEKMFTRRVDDVEDIKENHEDLEKELYYDKRIKFDRSKGFDWVVKTREEFDKYHLDIKRNKSTLDFFYYRDTGNVVSYNDKRTLKFYDIKKEHEPSKARMLLLGRMDIVFLGNTIISKRFKSSNDDFKNEYYKSQLNTYGRYVYRDFVNSKNPIFFLNVVKFSGKQGVHFDIVERERLSCYRANTFILQERYNLGNMKLMPMRVPMNVKLGYSEKEFRKMNKGLAKKTVDDGVNIPGYLRNIGKQLVGIGPQSMIFVKSQIAGLKLYAFFKKEVKITSHDIMRGYVDDEIKNMEDFYGKSKYDKMFSSRDMVWEVLNGPKVDRLGMSEVLDYVLSKQRYGNEIGEHLEEVDGGEGYSVRSQSMTRENMEIRESLDDDMYLVFLGFVPAYYYYIYHESRIKILMFKYLGICGFVGLSYYLVFYPAENFLNVFHVVSFFTLGIFGTVHYFYLRKYRDEYLRGKDIYLYRFRPKVKKKVLPFLYTKTSDWPLLDNEEYLKKKDTSGQADNSRYVKDRYFTVTQNTGGENYSIYCLIMAYIWGSFDTLKRAYYREYRGGYNGTDKAKYGDLICDFDGVLRKEFVYDRIKGGGNIFNSYLVDFYRKRYGYSHVKGGGEWPDYEDEKGVLKVFGAKPYGDRTRFSGILDYDWYQYKEQEYPDQYVIPVRGSTPLDSGYIWVGTAQDEHGTEMNNDLQERSVLKYELRAMRGWNDYVSHVTEDGGIFSNYKAWIRIAQSYGASDNKGLFRSYILKIVQYWLHDIDYLARINDPALNLLKHFREGLLSFEKNKKCYQEGLNAVVIKKKEMFETCEPKYINILSNINENEKNASIIYYNLMKYKYVRSNVGRTNLCYQNMEDNLLELFKSKDLSIVKEEVSFYGSEWFYFLTKLYKIHRYIGNMSVNYLKENKGELLKKLLSRKIKTLDDVIEIVGDIGYLFYYYIDLKEIFEIFIKMIKLYYNNIDLKEILEILIKMINQYYYYIDLKEILEILIKMIKLFFE